MKRQQPDILTMAYLWASLDRCQDKVLRARFEITDQYTLSRGYHVLTATQIADGNNIELELVMAGPTMLFRIAPPAYAAGRTRWIAAECQSLTQRSECTGQFLAAVPADKPHQAPLGFRVHLFAKSRELELVELNPANRLKMQTLFDGVSFSVS